MHDVLNKTKTLVLEDALVPAITEPGQCVNRDCLRNVEALESQASEQKSDHRVTPFKECSTQSWAVMGFLL